MGRLIALQKPGGGVRGIVCGDIIWGLVARSVAQQIAQAVQEAISPFQYALTTKAGGECVAHAVQSLTDLNGRVTVLFIDGNSAFDVISRTAMLDLLHQVRGRDKALPSVRQIYSVPSQYFWTDCTGNTHVIHQGEKGEQGDALMPMLYTNTFSPIWTTSTKCVCQKAWVRFCSNFRKLMISMPALKFTWGKPRFGTVVVRSRCTCGPPGENLARWKAVHNKVFVCWASQSAMRSLFRPSLGPPRKSTRRWSNGSIGTGSSASAPTHAQRTPSAASRQLRQSSLQPHMMLPRGSVSRDFLGISSRTDEVHDWASLPFEMGGCRLRSATRKRVLAHLASWADSLRMIHNRHPKVANTMVRSLSGLTRVRHFTAVASYRVELRALGCNIPEWENLPKGRVAS